MILVPFSLDPEALGEAQGIRAEQVSVHERFIEQWDQWGALVINDGDRELRRAFQELPQSVRKRWQTAISKCRVRRLKEVVPHSHTVRARADLRPLKGLARLAVFNAEVCQRLGLQDADLSAVLDDLDLEIARFSCLDRTDRFQAARALASEPIAPGTDPDEVWDARFAPLALFARSVKIVDPYAGSQFAKRKARSGLAFVLKKLGALSKPVSLSVFTVRKSESLSHNLIFEAKDFISDHALRFADFTLFEASEEEFSSHDRYLRFERYVARIGYGCAVFEPQATELTNHCNIGSATLQDRSLEEKLRERSVRTIVVRDR